MELELAANGALPKAQSVVLVFVSREGLLQHSELLCQEERNIEAQADVKEV